MNTMRKKVCGSFFFAIALLCVVQGHSDHVKKLDSLRSDVIVFSYNRPLQLYAFLESFDKFAKGYNQVAVICRCDTSAYKKAYDEVKLAFPFVHFVYQKAKNLNQEFEKLVKTYSFSSSLFSGKYITYAVDDIVLTGLVDFSEGIRFLEETGAYGFYYRLGLHIDHCFNLDRPSPPPAMKRVNNHCYSWNFSDGVGDWGYPNSVDMVLYRKKTIEKTLVDLHYGNPSLMEGRWATKGKKTGIGLCYKSARMVNIPMNIVTKTWKNRSIANYSPIELLRLFNKGLKIDILPLENIKKNTVHIEYDPTFVKR